MYYEALIDIIIVHLYDQIQNSSAFKKRKKMKHVFAKSFSLRSFPKTKGSSEQE